jgi:hypothetical protein
MKINQYFEIFENNNINDICSNRIINVTFENNNNNITIRHKRKKNSINSSQNLINNENVPGLNQNESNTDCETSINSLLETTNSTNNDASINNSSFSELFNIERTNEGPDTILTYQQVEKIENEIKKIKRKRINHDEAKHSQKYNNKKKIRNIFRKIGEILYNETSKIGLECIPIMVKKSPNIIKEFKVYYGKETFEEYMKKTKKYNEQEAMKFLLGKEEGLVTHKG